MAASEGEANRRQQAALTTAELNQKSDFFNQSREDNAMQFNAGLHQRSLEAQFGMQARMGEQQQHAELQNWLGQQDMSYKEKMRLQQMQNAVGEINADETLTPEEKMNYVRQIRTGIDAGKQRMQQEQTKHLQMQNQQLMDLHAKQVTMEDQAAQARSKTVQQRTQEVPLEGGGSMVVVEGADGKPHYQFIKAEEKLPVGTYKPVEYDKAVENLRKRITEEVTNDKSMRDEQKKGFVEAAVRERRDMPEFGGLGQSYEEYLGRKRGQTGQQSAAPSPQPVQAATPPPDMKPYKPDDLKSMNPVQRAVNDQFTIQANEIEARPDLPWDVKIAAANAVKDSAKLLAKAGGVVGKMPADDRRKFEQMKEFVRSLPPPPPPPAAAQAPQQPPAAPPPAAQPFGGNVPWGV